jgi:enterobactin synthetase component D
VKAKILVEHGARDSMITPENVAAFKAEMDKAGADYTFVSLDGAKHGFSNPDADRLSHGDHGGPDIGYNKPADEKSWADMQAFFKRFSADTPNIGSRASLWQGSLLPRHKTLDYYPAPIQPGKMPDMKPLPALPAFCTPLDAHWPLPHVLPDTVLLSTHFNTSQLVSDDFQRSAIEAPATIQRSVAKRQAEFLAGRVCARAALQQLEGLNVSPAIGEDRAPVWPAHITGSITHSTGRAAAIVAKKPLARTGNGPGKPAQRRTGRAPGRRDPHPPELQRMAAGHHDQLALWVTLTFSVKESLFKALYPIVRQRFYFEHAEVLEWTESGEVRLRLLTDLSAEWRNGTELDAQFGVKDGQLLSLVSLQA